MHFRQVQIVQTRHHLLSLFYK